MPLLFGVSDPSLLVDVLEGPYNGGAGSGVGRRIPIVREYHSNWTQASTSFASGNRMRDLFLAGHEMIVSYKPPSTYAQIYNGSQDAVIDALGDRIYGLPYGAPVSGSQAGAAYGGTTATKLRLCFHHEPDNDTSYGSADDFKRAYRHFFARLKSRRPNGTPERVISLPIFTGQANATGRALQFYPGNTAADYCDEIGTDVGFFGVPASNTSTFNTRIQPWRTWRDKNAPNRKLAVCETERFDTVPNSVAYINSMIAGFLANPDLSCLCVYSSPNGDAGSVRKAHHVETWQAFKDAMDDAYAATQAVDTTPPPAPLGLSASSVTSTTVMLTWQRPPVPDVAGYKIMRDGAVAFTITNPATLTYTISGQAPGSSHGYRIAAYDTASPANTSAYVGSTGTTAVLTVVHPLPAEPDPPAFDDAATDITINGHDAALNAVVNDPAGGPVVVAVDWGDGDTGTGATATHNYANAGNFQVKLTATSSVSSKSVTITRPVIIEDLEDVDRTTGKVSLWQPKQGARVGAFGPQLRENNNNITQSFEMLFQDRQVQNANDTPIIRRPIISVTGGTWTDEEPSDDYATGRTLLAITGGGGGGTVADGSITPSKLSFDPATQAELDAGLATKADVGFSDSNKVTVGSVARNTDSLQHGWVGRTFDAAAMSNGSGVPIAAGSVLWFQFVAEITANVTGIYFVVGTAASGSGFTVRLHNSSGVAVATATGVDAQLTSTGPSSVPISSTGLTRGSVYYVSFHSPAGSSGPNLRATNVAGSLVNLGLSAPNLRSASATASSPPTTLPLGSGTAFALAVVGVK